MSQIVYFCSLVANRHPATLSNWRWLASA